MRYKLYYQLGGSLEKVKENYKIKSYYNSISEAQFAMDKAYNTYYCDVLIIRQKINKDNSKETTNIAAIKPLNGNWINFINNNDVI